VSGSMPLSSSLKKPSGFSCARPLNPPLTFGRKDSLGPTPTHRANLFGFGPHRVHGSIMKCIARLLCMSAILLSVAFQRKLYERACGENVRQIRAEPPGKRI
jgi:hypothetical protein